MIPFVYLGLNGFRDLCGAVFISRAYMVRQAKIADSGGVLPLAVQMEGQEKEVALPLSLYQLDPQLLSVDSLLICSLLV